MPDERFKDRRGYCRLCHKVCFDSKRAAQEMVDATDIGLQYVYKCPLYPSGYWHVTSKSKQNRPVSYNVALKRLGPTREAKIRKRIEKILKEDARVFNDTRETYGNMVE